MDRNLARKLEAGMSEDSGETNSLHKKLTKLVQDYCRLGTSSVDHYVGEWDVAHDMLMAFAPLTKADIENLEKGHPKRWVLPMASTQLNVMTTFISQVLFGQDSPHKVEARGPEDEIPATHVNTLLKWNAEQQPTYLLGFLWVQDALVFNRGVFYNSWSTIYRPKPTVVQAIEVDTEGNPIFDEDGNPKKYDTVRMEDEPIGGYVKYELVSPYDWFCDPTLPLWRFQEGRFAGHKFRVPFTELLRRSELSPDDPEYVMPSAVEALKNRKGSSQTASPIGTTTTTPTTGGEMLSRSGYERTRSGNPLVDEKANAEDTGNVDGVELWVRLIPKDNGIHDGTRSSVFQIVVAKNNIILSVNESTHMHGMYPYSVGEGRPSGHFQFAPSYALLLKGLQDHVDYLKNRHQEALQRTVGNVFVLDPTMVDAEEFLNPDKEGLILQLKPAAQGRKISEVFQQIPIKDLTEGFPDEMASFVSYSETVSGATAHMQGAAGEADSATEFAGTQQMAAGRMSAVARLLSVQGLVPQTRQIVSMFQQFMTATQTVRFQGDPLNAPVELRDLNSLQISPDTIQGEFDFIAHDGTMPGTDARKVAAITRLLEGAALFPQVFAPAPGNLDPRQLIYAAAKASGVNPERFQYTPESLGQGVQGIVSNQAGVIPQFGGAAQPPQVPQAPIGAGTPGPAPATPSIEIPRFPGLPSAAPPEVRPTNF